MKKQWKMIATIAVVLVLLGGAAFMLSGDDAQEADGESQMVYKIEKTLLKDILVENSSDGYHLLCEENLEVEGLENLPVDESGLKKIFNASFELEAMKQVNDGGSRLEEFGLEHPKATVTLTKRNEDKIKIFIGDKTPEDDQTAYYVGCENEVYVVEEDALLVFFYGKENLISKTITPSYDSSSDEISIKEISVRREDETIKIQHQDSENLAGYVLDSYYILEPIKYAATPSISEEFIPSLFDLSAVAVAAVRPSEKELEKFGLEEPYVTVDVSYSLSGEDVALKIRSSKPTEDGLVYVQNEVDEVVYLCTTSQITWSDMTVQDLVSKSVITPDIRTLESLAIETEEEDTQEFKLENMDDTENAKVSYNGTELEMDNFKNFYYSLISVTADEVVFDEFPKMSTDDMILKVQFRYSDGSEDEVCYYDQGARQVYAELNDKECGYRLNTTQIETVKNTLGKLINGEKIEARY